MNFLRSKRFRFVMGGASLIAVGVLTVGLTASAQPSGHPAFPPEKQAALDREAATLTAARNAPQPSKAQRAAPDVQPDPPRLEFTRTPAGQGVIVETGFNPFGPEFAAENRWVEHVGAQDLAVVAGASRGDPDQGLVAVFMSELRTGRDGWYPTPAKAGSVHIVSAVGERLTLASRNGTMFVFDVAARQFVSK
jgi:hypothetical protein